jgi:ATP-dependent Lon protease
MGETLTLPVLPLDDAVVLPTMVVPLDMSDGEVRAAIEAARAVADGRPDVPGIRSSAKPRVLMVPRLEGKYSPVGTLGLVE